MCVSGGSCSAPNGTCVYVCTMVCGSWVDEFFFVNIALIVLCVCVCVFVVRCLATQISKTHISQHK